MCNCPRSPSASVVLGIQLGSECLEPDAAREFSGDDDQCDVASVLEGLITILLMLAFLVCSCTMHNAYEVLVRGICTATIPKLQPVGHTSTDLRVWAMKHLGSRSLGPFLEP